MNSYNLFAYCENNPIMQIDSDGFFWKTLKALGEKMVEAAVVVAGTGVVAVAAGEIGSNIAYSKGDLKGKSFRGGSNSTRDNWYGYNEKEFHKGLNGMGKSTTMMEWI